MPSYGLAAAAVVAGHILFVLVAAVGALLVLRWPRFAWIQLPCAAWAAYVEFTGRICPLTPIENDLRRRAGLDAYSGDFVARYLFPVLYPEGLTREAQIVAGAVVIVLNACVYGWLIARRLRGPR